MLRRVFAFVAVFAAFVTCSQAAVTRVEVAERVDLPVNGYERIAGKVYFAVDPKLPANRAIVDIDLAPRNAAGLVEFSADLLVLRPKDAAKSNGTAFLEIANRGSQPFLGALNIGGGPRHAQHAGPGRPLHAGSGIHAGVGRDGSST